MFYTAWLLVSQSSCRRAGRQSTFFLTHHLLLILCLENTWGAFILHLLSLGSTNPKTSDDSPPCTSVSCRTTVCLTVALHEPELHQLRPHCGLTSGDRSHLKEGKQWENRQKELHLLEDLKLWIFLENHCT